MAFPSAYPPAPRFPLPPPGSIGRPNAPLHKRGGQPGNQNARKLGTFSHYQPGPLRPTRDLAKGLRLRLKNHTTPPAQIAARAHAARQELPLPAPDLASLGDFIPLLRLFCNLSGIISSAWASCTPSILLADALASLAHDPLSWMERGFRDAGISRDADSFFTTSKKSAQNSPLPPGHPILATNLTDSQWAVLAPLIPPDPCHAFLTGDPPVLIAANRWGFIQPCFPGELADFVIIKEYHKVVQCFPALRSEPDSLAAPLAPAHPPGLGRPRRRGHPRTSPRLLLDAIFWKLATGQKWSDLPAGFPPPRVCARYYRRLFHSGRLYTLLFALYNHFRLNVPLGLPGLLEAGLFTTTPSQKIALSPAARPTWENYTGLLFMQLARSAYTRLQRQHKQAHPHSLPLLPVFKGAASLSTGIIPSRKLPEPELAFQPLEDSLAWKKWRKIERDQKTLAREVSKRLRMDQAAPPARAGSACADEQDAPPAAAPPRTPALPSKSAHIPKDEGSRPQPEQELRPLQDSLAWKKWQKIEQDQRTIAEEVAKRLRSTGSG